MRQRDAVAHLCLGDARVWVDLLAGGAFAAVMTSPPYWGLRRYTTSDDEVGIGSLGSYVDAVVSVVDGTRRVLRDTGVVWLNIGDTAVGSGGAGGDYRSRSGRRAGRPLYRQGPADGLARGQWADVPGRVVHALQDRGWLLRSRVTWDKGLVRPEDLRHVRRPGVASESVFFLSRSMRYRFDPDALCERGDVWHVPAERTRTGHQAPFPTELVERCLAPVTGRGDWVLDPFCGSGSTLAWAARSGRVGVGVELHEDMVDVVRQRCGGAVAVWRYADAGRLRDVLASTPAPAPAQSGCP